MQINRSAFPVLARGRQEAGNSKFIHLLNSQVEKAEMARRDGTYNDDAHMTAMHTIIGWRNSGAVHGFSATSKNPNAAAIHAGYAAQVKQIKDWYKARTVELKANYTALLHEANDKAKQAHRLKDRAGELTMKNAIKAAADQYKRDVSGTKVAFNNALKQAKADFTTAMADPTGGLPVPFPGSPVPVPVVGPSPFPIDAPPGSYVPPPATYVQPPMYFPQPSYNPAFPPGGYYQQPQYGPPQVYQPPYDPNQGAPQPQYLPPVTLQQSDDLAVTGGSGDWFTDLFGGPAPIEQPISADYGPPVLDVQSGQRPQYQPQFAPPVMVAQDNYYSPLDVFDDAWGGFGCAITGSNTIKQINSMPVIPAKAVGFGQWAAIASGVIQAGATIGAAALVPHQQTPTRPIAPPPSSNNNMMLMIGGGVALVAVILIASKK